MIKRLFLLLLVLIAAGTVAAIYLVPWNSLLENRLTAFLHDKGFDDISFKIDKVGLYQATLNNVMIGKENPLLLQSITIKYNPKEVAEGNFQDLTLNGLDVAVVETDDGWKIAGFEGFQSSSSETKASPSLSSMIDILPFSHVSITDSNLRVVGKSIQTVLPFSLNLTKAPDRSLEVIIASSHIISASNDIALGDIKLRISPDDTGKWSGEWSVASVDMGRDAPVPVMKGGGTLAYLSENISMDGTLNDGSNAYKASFRALYDLENAANTTLTIKSVSLPFKEGKIMTQNVIVPLGGSKAITIPLQIQKVSIDALMQTLTGKRVSATGTVSGRVPVILKRDGTYTIGKGSLKADSNGLIQMPGDVIPGDNEQVGLVREILENLHYKVFSAAVETNGKNGMTVRLSLEGNNPDVYNGRPVKLNVNLTGDLLDFVQQNAMLITNPEKLLQQGK